MAKKPPKRPRDPNQLARRVVELATGEAADPDPKLHAGQRKGGKKGAASRAKALTPEQKSEIARVAAAARWKKSD
jgi:hypothetical protein